MMVRQELDDNIDILMLARELLPEPFGGRHNITLEDEGRLIISLAIDVEENLHWYSFILDSETDVEEEVNKLVDR